MFVYQGYAQSSWTPRHAALASYLQSRGGLFAGPRLSAAQMGARLRADPEWRRLCAAIGSPDVQLVRGVVGAALPFWLGVDADLLAEGMRLACVGDTAAALVVVALAVIVLAALLLSRGDA